MTSRYLTTDFLVALEDWQEANAEYREARDAYDGPSPDWALQVHWARCEDATKRLDDAIALLVETAVKKAMENIGARTVGSL